MPEREGNPTPTVDGQLRSGDATATLAVVTVTYNPDIEILGSQLSQLPARAAKVVVDNASTPELRAELRRLLSDRDDVWLLENSENVGLARALNQGAAYAQRVSPACRYLLLLDQDTEPGPGGAESLLDAFRQLRTEDARLGCVGPRLIDENTGLEHGFHQIAGWRWVRRFPLAPTPLSVANVNGSGILMEITLFNELGGLNESFFIDHVDTDWSFRVRASGHSLYGIPGVRFTHRMGVTGIRYWLLGWRVWPYRSPGRHYYLFRNTARLLGRADVPWVWKLWAPVKLLVTFVAHLAFDSARWAQAGKMISGFRAGISGRA